MHIDSQAFRVPAGHHVDQADRLMRVHRIGAVRVEWSHRVSRPAELRAVRGQLAV